MHHHLYTARVWSGLHHLRDGISNLLRFQFQDGALDEFLLDGLGTRIIEVETLCLLPTDLLLLEGSILDPLLELGDPLVVLFVYALELFFETKDLLLDLVFDVCLLPN